MNTFITAPIEILVSTTISQPKGNTAYSVKIQLLAF